MKVAFFTLGCKVNQYETNAMAEQFEKNGYEIVSYEQKADIYIINTCTVTSISDKKSRQMIRKSKTLNPNAIIAAVGCYAQTARQELEKIQEIDLILGNHEKKDIVEFIENYAADSQHIAVADLMQEKEFDDFGEVTYTDKTRAVIKIQDGCDRFCSYCIIPYARGRVRSRKIESVRKEVEKIAALGIKEIVMTGIHIASYGKDFKENITLMDLLQEVNKIEGILRIRLGSLEPTLMTEEFVKKLKELDKICNHFHLSLQSGCNDTLKRMNRKYTTEEFKQSTLLLRKYFPNVLLTTDIIVGFPGETKEEFDKTYEFLKTIKFYRMHVFKYSKRTGTKACEMENQVPEKEKEERSRKLINLSDETEREYEESYIDREIDVLFEEEEGNFLKGHTANYMMIYVKKDECIKKLLNAVKIQKRENEKLIGNVIQ